MIYLIGLATIFSTLFGGLFAMRFRDKLHLILGFSAGAVLGVAFFDLLPESVSLTAGNYHLSILTILIAAGFSIFMILDRFFSIHPHDEENCEKPSHRGNLAAGALILHSFIDGLAIGLAFKVSLNAGFIVAAAVLSHDFSDGINTVNMILKNQGKKNSALKWLIADALAPFLGICATLFFSVSEPVLGLILATFCGIFIYLGASDLIPESHHRHPSFWTTFTTILGLAVLYFIVQLAG